MENAPETPGRSQRLPCRSHTENRKFGNRKPRNKPRRRALYRRTGHPFPLPPCLAGQVGRSRYADRLRPDFFHLPPGPFPAPSRFPRCSPRVKPSRAGDTVGGPGSGLGRMFRWLARRSRDSRSNRGPAWACRGAPGPDRRRLSREINALGRADPDLEARLAEIGATPLRYSPHESAR